jgi:hypothetical protein
VTIDHDLIRDRTRDFTGRDWVFAAIANWLRDPSASRVFLLVGGPGTGKSAIAARLVQASLGEVVVPGLDAGFLDHAHFCQAGRDSTLSPLTFVQELSEDLANRYPEFYAALQRNGSQQVVINAQINVGGNVGANAQLNNSTIERITLQIRGGDARPLFDQLVRIPLVALCAARPDVSVRILVDSLDESLTFHPTENIAQLLKLARDFPPQVRFVLTGRSNEDRVTAAVGKAALDLDASQDDDVKSYVEARLAGRPDPERTTLAARIAEGSKGNFLYAQHVVDDVLADKVTLDMLLADLPDSLEEVYRRYLERELAADPRAWQDTYRTLLGTIAVSQGDGLTRSQVVQITGLPRSKVNDALAVCRPYLRPGAPEDPLGIYHHSFREFLLGDHAFGVYPDERHAAIAKYFFDRHGADWVACDDAYALRYAPVHMAEGMRARPELVDALVDIVTSRAYQHRCAEYLLDVPMVIAQVQRAIGAVTRRGDEGPVRYVFVLTRELAELRARFLRGDSVVALACAGDIATAEARLPLFDELDRDWQTAATLILAWLAIDSDPAAATLACERARASARSAPLDLLLARVEAALRKEPAFAFASNESGPLEIARQLVLRLTGQAFDHELLISSGLGIESSQGQSELIQADHYAASLDGPILVAIAREHGDDGTIVLDEYIAAHAGYNYVHYRNRSLWVLLQAVLTHHPEQHWVRDRLERILEAALEGGGVSPTRIAPVFAAALCAGDDAPVAGFRMQVLAAIDKLGNRRGANDSFAIHRRRLIGLVEVEALVRGDENRARIEVDRIVGLENSRVLDGFAGFRTPAELRLADALRTCRIGDSKLVEARLAIALTGAHQIQDYRFCARVTARCNTLRWWHRLELDTPALDAAIDRLVASPSSVEFATQHAVGEPFEQRAKTSEQLSLAPATDANTIERLAEVFQRPVIEFLRLNPDLVLTTIIRAGKTVHVPDPGFAPLLALHLAGRVLVGGAGKQARVRQVRRLVPVAAANPAAVDGILCYLLVAMRPSTAAAREILSSLGGLEALGEVAPPEGNIRKVSSDAAPPAVAPGGA